MICDIRISRAHRETKVSGDAGGGRSRTGRRNGREGWVSDQTVLNRYVGVPHFVQNLAPSLRELPQFLHTDMAGATGTAEGAGIA